MSDDILDSIEDILGEDEAQEFSGEVIEGEIVDYEIENLDTSTLNEKQARALTDSIKSTAEALYVMLCRAHEGKAYQVLGYETWRDYVESEFDFSVSHSYRLLNLGVVSQAIEEAVPEGTHVAITEAQARDIKRALPEVTERVKKETVDKTPEEASGIVDDIIEETREQQKEAKKATEEKQKLADEEAQQAEYDALEAEANALLEADNASGGLSGREPDDDAGAYTPDTEGLSPKDTTALYTLYQFVNGQDSLIDPELMARLIPDAEIDDMKKNANKLASYFEHLAKELAKL